MCGKNLRKKKATHGIWTWVGWGHRLTFTTKLTTQLFCSFCFTKMICKVVCGTCHTHSLGGSAPDCNQTGVQIF